MSKPFSNIIVLGIRCLNERHVSVIGIPLDGYENSDNYEAAYVQIQVPKILS